MRIAFILIGNSRRSNYLNGETLRYGGGGGSGTDTSTILVAEYLASQGHEVVVVTDKLEPLLEKSYAEEGKFFPKGDVIRGVQYTDIEFNHIDNKEFDVLVNSLWFHDYDKLPIKVTKSLIYWCHMQWIYGIEETIKYAKSNNLNLGFVNISEWEKQMNIDTIKSTIQRYENTKTTLIPNPICDDVIKEVLSENIERKPHKFIFHASWARGGNVAIEAVEKLEFPDKEFHAFDYLITIHDHKHPYFYRHDGVDKKTLFKHLAESDYFLYPLYTPYQDVHKDTFSCVVAEAIALGAIPITYPLGALPENFDGFCQWIKFPNGILAENLQKESLTKDLNGNFKNNIENILDSINFLENNPEIKNKIRENGKNYILEKFNIKKVGDMWIDFLNSLQERPKIEFKNFFDEGFYINLDYKPDRNETIKKILKEYDLEDKIKRSQAVKAFDYTIKCNHGTVEWKTCHDACTRSHLNIIRDAKNRNIEKLLIFEDDIMFIEDGITPSIQKINDAINDLINVKWDILYLGGVLLDETLNKVTKNLLKVDRVNGSHAYILNKSAYDPILNEYHFGYPMDCLLTASLKNKYSVVECLLAQSGDDISDIGGHETHGPKVFIESYKKPDK